MEKSISAQSTTGSVTILDLFAEGKSFGYIQGGPTAELVWAASIPAFWPINSLEKAAVWHSSVWQWDGVGSGAGAEHWLLRCPSPSRGVTPAQPHVQLWKSQRISRFRGLTSSSSLALAQPKLLVL